MSTRERHRFQLRDLFLPPRIEGLPGGSAHPETLGPVHAGDRAHGEERYPVGVPAPANRA